MYKDSYISLQIGILCTTSTLYFLFEKLIDVRVIDNNFIDILNGFGVMTAFFILAIDKIDFKVLKDKLNYEIKIGRNDKILMSNKMINTIFSLMISMFLLLGYLYIAVIFGRKSLFPLMLLCVMLFIGFVFLICIWHWTEK